MKIMSNELLIVSYRSALKSNENKEWAYLLKQELIKRNLKPIKKA